MAIKAMAAMKRDTTTAPSFGPFLDKILRTQRRSLQLWVSPIAVYKKCFEYGMRRGGAANYAGYKK